MRVRADIVALINAGLDDNQIADELGCHRTTPYQVRRALAEASLNVAARVLAEELPTGRVRELQAGPHADQLGAGRRQLCAPPRRTPRRSRLTAVPAPAAPPTRLPLHTRQRRSTR